MSATLKIKSFYLKKSGKGSSFGFTTIDSGTNGKVMVNSVTKNSVADKSKLTVGSYIIGIDERPLPWDSFVKAKSSLKHTDEIELLVVTKSADASFVAVKGNYAEAVKEFMTIKGPESKYRGQFYKNSKSGDQKFFALLKIT
uniref:PDZ domain-containing protein n=1 Tax=Ditylenchus dipsaci TaxID=166011 RepID=A0A915EVY7_9BILA